MRLLSILALSGALGLGLVVASRSSPSPDPSRIAAHGDDSMRAPASRLTPAPASSGYRWIRAELDAAGAVCRRVVGDRLVVGLEPGMTDEDLATLCTRLHCHPERRLRIRSEAYWLIALPDPTRYDAVRHALNRHPGIRFVEGDQLIEASGLVPNDPAFGDLWGLHNEGGEHATADADIDAPEAWERETGSRSVVVGIVDSGIDITHPDLAPNIWTNPGETGTDQSGADKATNGVDDDGNGFVDDVHGWDFIDDDNQPLDEWLHGTHVAGTVGAVGDNGTHGVGVAWAVQLIPIRAIDFSVNDGAGVVSTAAEGLDYAIANGAHITTHSYGGQPVSTLMRETIARAEAAGVLVVTSSGNESRDNDRQPRFPSSYRLDNVIAIAASDAEDAVAVFDQPPGLTGGQRSNVGQTSVDLAAPGNRIYSTYPSYETDFMAANGYATHYGWLSGTSMAVPHVAGIAALVKSRHPELDSRELRGLLMAGVDQPPAWAGQVASGGRANAARTLELADRAASGPLVVMHAWDLLDNGLGGSAGNGDGHCQVGERLVLRVHLRNVGSAAAPPGNATLTAIDAAGIDILDPNVTWDGLAADADLVIDLGIDLTNPTTATARLALRHDDGGGNVVERPLHLAIEGRPLDLTWEAIAGLEVAARGDDSQAVSSLTGRGQMLLATVAGLDSQRSGLYRSVDGGATWGRLTAAAPPPGSFTEVDRTPLAADPSDDDRYYVSGEGAEGGVWRSDDAGATWTQTAGPATLVFGSQRHIASQDLLVEPSGRIIAPAVNRWFTSVDQGTTWMDGGKGSAPVDRSVGRGSQGGTLLVGGSNQVFTPAPSDEMIVYRSTNDGVTWTRASGPTRTHTSIEAFATVPGFDPPLYCADRDNGVYASDDDGRTWSPVACGVGDPDALLATTTGILPAPGLLVLGDQGGPTGPAQWSADGVLWAPAGRGLPTDPPPLGSGFHHHWSELVEIPGSGIYACGSRGLFRLGASGNRSPTADAQTVTVDPGASVTFTLGGSDPDGDALRVIIDAEPTHGRLTQRLDGTWTYAPAPGSARDDQLVFRVHDGLIASEPVTVPIVVGTVDARRIVVRITGTADDVVALRLPDGSPLTETGRNEFEADGLDPVAGQRFGFQSMPTGMGFLLRPTSGSTVARVQAVLP